MLQTEISLLKGSIFAYDLLANLLFF